jgi:hypothetical protein
MQSLTVPSTIFLIDVNGTAGIIIVPSQASTRAIGVSGLDHRKKVLLKDCYAFLYTWMDFFQSHQTVPSRCYLTFFHIPTFNWTSKTTGWFTKGELKLIPTCPTLTKCYSKVAHAFLYTWMDFFQVAPKLLPKPLLSYLLPYSTRSIALVKRLAGSPKG